MKAFKLLLFFIICFSFSGTGCLSQKPDLSFRHINALNGLSHGFTRKVLQDHEGYMWFATADGLNKYDGYKMIVYKTDIENPNSITSSDVQTIFEDSRKNLWIGTSKGLNLYLREQNHFLHFPEIGDEFINFFLEDSNNDLWVTSKKNIWKYNEENRKFVKLPMPEPKAFACLFEDSNKTIWVGTFEGLEVLDRKTNALRRETRVTVTDISCIYEDSENNLWIGSRVMGVVVFNPKKGTSKLYQKELNIPNNVVLTVAGDSSGRIWIGTENGGLSIYNPASGKFHQYLNNPADPESLCFNSVYSIASDNQKNIWLGTYTGVELVKRDKFTHVRADFLNKNSLSGNNILSFCEDKQGNIWIGTDGEGLNKYNPLTQKYTHYKHDPNNPKSISSDAITYLMNDKDGNLWVGTWGGGLNLFNPEKEEFTRFQMDTEDEHSIRNDNIAHIYQDKRGNIWVGVGSGIEMLDRKNNEFRHYNYYFPNSLLTSYPGDILEDRDGNLWIGTFEGLCIFDRDKNVIEPFLHSDKEKNSISSNVIYTLYEDSKGNLWVGTIGGLNLFNKKNRTFKTYHQRDGLPSDAIYGILEDGEGNLWISTSNGISKFNPEKETFKNYNIDDGLQGNEFKLNAFYKLKSGELLFGGDNGFNLFHPDKIKDNPVVPPVILTDFKIFNKSVPIGEAESPLSKHISQTKDITISYKNSVISFEFAALNYFSPERNQYAYILEGFDNEWNYVGNKREATYTSLEPGSYIFRVKASNNDGVWNEKGTSLKITITPPFWKTWWFKVLLLLVFLLLLNVFIKIRVNSLKKQKEVLKKLVLRKTKEIKAKNKILEKANLELSIQKEEILKQKNEILEMSLKVKEADEKKLKFFVNISHEIRTPLTLILGPAERLIKRTASEPKINEEINVLYKNAGRLLTLINELMDFNKMDNGQMKVMLQKGDLVKFCSSVISAFNVLSRKNKVTLEYNPGIQQYMTWFDAGKVEIILFNLISNAFKFTPGCGKITIHLRVKEQEGCYEIEVSDSGIGIEKEKINKIFDRYYQIESTVSQHNGSGLGLAYTKELIGLMGGEINVFSTVGKGTSFVFHLPILDTALINQNDKYIQLPETDPEVRHKLLTDIIEPYRELEENAEIVNNEGLKILVVDDNPDLRKYIRSCLGERYTIYEAGNGNEGLANAKKYLPDLILSDVMMPEMDGMEFCRQVKEDFEISHIPVILLTAKTDEEARIEGYGKGADGYITKPFTNDLLLSRIENLVHSRKKLRESFKEKVILEPKEITLSSPDEKFLIRVLEIVQENLHKSEFDATQLIKELGMSRSLVYMKLKELIDLSPAEFIKTTRLKRASQLLREKKYRISDVCYMAGFNDPHYFTISFKKLFGKTPSDFIEEAV